MQEEFQRTVKKLKTEIEQPDFKPFKHVKDQRVKLKRTRITKKPLEYLGSGIGTSSALMIKNSKKLSLVKNTSVVSPAKTMNVPDGKNVSFAAQVILDSLSQSPMKKRRETENPYKEQDVKVTEILSRKEQEKLLKQVQELDSSIKLKETFPNKWLQEVHAKGLPVESLSQGLDKVQPLQGAIESSVSKPAPSSQIESATLSLNQTAQAIQAKIMTPSIQPTIIPPLVASINFEDVKKNSSEKYQFSQGSSFQNIQNQKVKDMPEASLPKFDFGIKGLQNPNVFLDSKPISPKSFSGDSQADKAKQVETPKMPVPTSTAAPAFNWAAAGTSFKPVSTNNWECAVCMVSNKPDSAKCISCESDKPGLKKIDAPKPVEAPKMPVPTSTAAPAFNWAAAGTSFKPVSTNNWECAVCMVSNKPDSVKCISCESDKPGSKKIDTPKPVEAPKMPVPTSTAAPAFNWAAAGTSFKPVSTNNWECAVCMVSNKPDSVKCISCEPDKPGSKKIDTPKPVEAPKMPVPTSTAAPAFNWAAAGTSFKPVSTNNWECAVCMVSNKPDSAKCISCESDKPGLKKIDAPKPVEAPKMPVPTSTAAPAFNWAAAGTSFKPVSTNNWECAVCMVSNKPDSVKCISCESDKPGSKKIDTPKPVEAPKMPVPTSTAAPAFNWAAAGTSFKAPASSALDVAKSKDASTAKLSETTNWPAPSVATFNWGASLNSSPIADDKNSSQNLSPALGSSIEAKQTGFTFGSFSAAPSQFGVGFSFGSTQPSTSIFGASTVKKDDPKNEKDS